MVDSAVTELNEFMTVGCFVYKNQSQTTRGYLSAIKYFHKIFAGWQLPTLHFMVIAAGKGIDETRRKSDVRPQRNVVGGIEVG